MNEREHEALAAVEDRMWHFAALHAHVRRMLQRGGWRGEGRLLDVGCGTGGLLRRLRGWFPRAELNGIDFAPRAVELARQRTGLAIGQGSALALPVPDGSLAAITCVDVVYQFDDPVAAYREFGRALAPGGVLVINEPAFQWLWSYHDEHVGGRRRFRRPAIRALFRAAGLTPVDATYWNCLATPLVWARRKFGGRSETSDVREYGWWISLPMRALLAIERVWLALGLRSPVGTSVLAVAVKNLEPSAGARHT